MHGHNYRVVVTVTAERLDEQGMVIDFADLKAICQQAIDPLDHTVLNELPPFAEANPTAEELARHIYKAITAMLGREGAEGGRLKPAVPGGRVMLERVTVYESDRSYATYATLRSAYSAEAAASAAKAGSEARSLRSTNRG